MTMRDILLEWRRFLDTPILNEGGNATAREYDSEGKIVASTWNGEVAQAKPIIFDELVSRSEFIEEAVKAIRVINKLHKATTDSGLYDDSVLDFLMSGYTFMGSSEFLFSKEISDEEYNKHKKKTGDIDLLVPKSKISSLYDLLNRIKGKRLTDKITFVGHNKVTEAQIREEQINGVLEYSASERRFLFQIDFVFVPFDSEGKPFEEEKFLRGSSWSDITMGIKGIGHKLLLQSLGSRIQTIPYGSAFLATPTSRAEKPRLQAKLPKIDDIRLGTIGNLEEEDLHSFIPPSDARNLKKLHKTLKTRVSKEEVARFIDSASSKPERMDFFKQILEKSGTAQNQSIKLLVTYIVHSPTVEDFNLDTYFDSFSSLMSFSMGRGLSTKYRKEPYQVGGKDVYRYLKFDEREQKFRKAEEIFKAIFGAEPTVQDVRDAASFVGLLRIMSDYLNSDKQIRAYDGLMFYFYESENFMSAHTMEDDLGPKSIIMRVFEDRLPEVKNSRKYKDKEAILNNWIARYQERLASS
jgi:YD repeat-containing protein